MAAHPDQVWIELPDRKLRVTPEQLAGERREEAWQRITTAQPRFAKYQTKTDRPLPVIRLVPGGTADGTTAGTADGTTAGTADATTDGTTAGTAGGITDATTAGTTDATTTGTTDSTAAGTTDGTAGPADGTTDGTQPGPDARLALTRSGGQPVQGGPDPLLRHRLRGAQCLGEQADPQLLDHPADRGRVVAGPGRLAELAQRLLVGVRDPVHDRHPFRVARRRLRHLVQPADDGPAGNGPGRAAAASPVSAMNPG